MTTCPVVLLCFPAETMKILDADYQDERGFFVFDPRQSASGAHRARVLFSYIRVNLRRVRSSLWDRRVSHFYIWIFIYGHKV